MPATAVSAFRIKIWHPMTSCRLGEQTTLTVLQRYHLGLLKFGLILIAMIACFQPVHPAAAWCASPKKPADDIPSPLHITWSQCHDDWMLALRGPAVAVMAAIAAIGHFSSTHWHAPLVFNDRDFETQILLAQYSIFPVQSVQYNNDDMFLLWHLSCALGPEHATRRDAMPACRGAIEWPGVQSLELSYLSLSI